MDTDVNSSADGFMNELVFMREWDLCSVCVCGGRGVGVREGEVYLRG